MQPGGGTPLLLILLSLSNVLLLLSPPFPAQALHADRTLVLDLSPLSACTHLHTLSLARCTALTSLSPLLS